MGEHEKKKCEHCGGTINEQYTVCPLCGGHLREEMKPLLPTCPHCKVSLEIQVHDGDEYDICSKCGGIWLDRGEFQKATRPSGVRCNEDFAGEFLREPVKEQKGYIPCVRCGKLMNRKNFRRISGVIIDECSRHGVWLDHGELKKIQHFIADGGLDRSQDREIEQTRTELRDLATKVNQTAFVQKMLHFWNFKRWLFGG